MLVLLSASARTWIITADLRRHLYGFLLHSHVARWIIIVSFVSSIILAGCINREHVLLQLFAKFERAIEEGNVSARPVKVFFHSHLDCGAYFSAEDAASMTMGGGHAPTHQLCYLVTAVDQGQVTAHKLFIWDEKTRGFIEAPFEVAD